MGKIESGERQLSVSELCEYTDALVADAADIIRAGLKASRRCERSEKNLQLSTLERVCESLDVPMGDVIRDAERAE